MNNKCVIHKIITLAFLHDFWYFIPTLLLYCNLDFGAELNWYSKWGHQDNFKPVFFFCFFLWKDFERTKTQIKPKPTNKNTNKWTKNNKDSNFLRIKTSKRGKIDYFVLWCFLYAQNLFVKKISWFEIVFIASFTILQTCTPINPPIENSFLRTYFYLWSSVRIFSVYENLFLLWESFGISIICVSMSLSK